jgi:hypothetical protein
MRDLVCYPGVMTTGVLEIWYLYIWFSRPTRMTKPSATKNEEDQRHHSPKIKMLENVFEVCVCPEFDYNGL